MTFEALKTPSSGAKGLILLENAYIGHSDVTKARAVGRVTGINTVETQAQLVNPVKNSRMFEGRASADNGATWLPTVLTGDSRHILFTGLTPGQEYTIQIRALGGSTGQSDWSDPVKHRSM